MIKGLYCQHDENNDETYVVMTTLKTLIYFYKKSDVTNDEHMKEFKARVKSMDDFNWCIVGGFPFLIENK